MSDTFSPCFQDIAHENIDHCSNTEIEGGTAIDLFYIPVDFIKTMTLPATTPGTSYAERITIASGGIVLKTGKSWKKITLLVDENELGSTLVGNKGNKKLKAEFDGFVPNHKKENIGFIDTHKNTPMVYAIPLSSGQFWIVGTTKAPAFFEEFTTKSGKKIDDNSGSTIKVSANTKPFAYDGEIVAG